jgi:hypothetical protein
MDKLQNFQVIDGIIYIHENTENDKDKF